MRSSTVIIAIVSALISQGTVVSALPHSSYSSGYIHSGPEARDLAIHTEGHDARSLEYDEDFEHALVARASAGEIVGYVSAAVTFMSGGAQFYGWVRKNKHDKIPKAMVKASAVQIKALAAALANISGLKRTPVRDIEMALTRSDVMVARRNSI